MTTWFISRHQGAIEWIKQQNIHIDRYENHLEDLKEIQKGDIIIGALPINLAAKICAKGAKFYYLSITLSKEQRGQELSAEEMQKLNCQIKPYYIQEIKENL